MKYEARQHNKASSVLLIWSHHLGFSHKCSLRYMIFGLPLAVLNLSILVFVFHSVHIKPIFFAYRLEGLCLA